MIDIENVDFSKLEKSFMASFNYNGLISVSELSNFLTNHFQLYITPNTAVMLEYLQGWTAIIKYLEPHDKFLLKIIEIMISIKLITFYKSHFMRKNAHV